MVSSARNHPEKILTSTAGERERFTPGPWQSKYGDYAPATELVQIIGNVDANWHGDGLCYTNVCEISESTDEAANTRLICAAPDMYEALKEFVRVCEHGNPMRIMHELGAACDMAKSALAKAEGKS